MQAQNQTRFSDRREKMNKAIKLNKDLKVRQNKSTFLKGTNLNQIAEERNESESSNYTSSKEAEPLAEGSVFESEPGEYASSALSEFSDISESLGAIVKPHRQYSEGECGKCNKQAVILSIKTSLLTNLVQ